MSMKNLIQSTDTARFCGTLPVAASGAPAPGWKSGVEEQARSGSRSTVAR